MCVCVCVCVRARVCECVRVLIMVTCFSVEFILSKDSISFLPNLFSQNLKQIIFDKRSSLFRITKKKLYKIETKIGPLMLRSRY